MSNPFYQFVGKGEPETCERCGQTRSDVMLRDVSRESTLKLRGPCCSELPGREWMRARIQAEA